MRNFRCGRASPRRRLYCRVGFALSVPCRCLDACIKLSGLNQSINQSNMGRVASAINGALLQYHHCERKSATNTGTWSDTREKKRGFNRLRTRWPAGHPMPHQRFPLGWIRIEYPAAGDKAAVGNETMREVMESQGKRRRAGIEMECCTFLGLERRPSRDVAAR